VGWAIGAWLDRHYHQEWISIVGILVGAVGGFIQLFRAANRMMKKDE
jgi:F0F1-type ATP synthase assembly protein I